MKRGRKPIQDEFTNLDTRGKKYYHRHKKEMLERSKRYNKSNQFEFVTPFQNIKNKNKVKSNQWDFIDREKITNL